MLDGEFRQNPYASPGTGPVPAEAPQPHEDWTSFEPNFDHGIVLCGRLRRADERRAVALRTGRRGTSSIRRVAALLLAIICLGWPFLLPDRPPQPAAAGMAALLRNRYFLLGVFAALALYVVLAQRIIRVFSRRRFEFEPVELLFAKAGLYRFDSTGWHIAPWRDFELYEAPDLLVLHLPAVGLMRTIPRRFARSDADWASALELARRLTMNQTSSPRALGSLPRETDPRRHEHYCFRDQWRRFEPAAGEPIVGKGALCAEDLKPLLRLTDRWIAPLLLFSASMVILGVGVASFQAAGSPWQLAFLGGAAAFALFLLVVLLRIVRYRFLFRPMAQRLADHVSTCMWTIRSNSVESCGQRGRSTWGANALRLHAATSEAVTLTVGQTNQFLVLPRHLFSATDWPRLQAQVGHFSTTS